MELTVSEYVLQIKKGLAKIGHATVQGEVQECREFGKGVISFMLVDNKAKIPCKFLPWGKTLIHKPKTGDLVKVQISNLTYWDAGGRVDADIAQIELAGEGFLLEQRLKLISKLEQELLTQPSSWGDLPIFPQTIGVISGENSDALADIIVGIKSRMPCANIVICPATVQGIHAVDSLISALDSLNKTEVELIIMARGGGAAHDLIAFDDEKLCRAIHASAKPVIVAIGHTKDNPVCNYITHKADLPRAAAVMAVRDSKELLAEFDAKTDLMNHQLKSCQTILAKCTTMYRQIVIDYQLQAFENKILTSANILQDVAHLVTGHTTNQEKMMDLFNSAAIQKIDQIKQNQQIFDERSIRLSQSKNRILNRLQSDYTRALDRTCRERERATSSYLKRYDNSVDSFLNLIAAHDFRKQGYIVATTADGKQVRSINQISPGQELVLSFEDGKTIVVVKEQQK